MSNSNRLTEFVGGSTGKLVNWFGPSEGRGVGVAVNEGECSSKMRRSVLRQLEIGDLQAGGSLACLVGHHNIDKHEL